MNVRGLYNIRLVIVVEFGFIDVNGKLLKLL